MCIYSPMPHTLSYCALIGKCALIRSNTVYDPIYGIYTAYGVGFWTQNVNMDALVVNLHVMFCQYIIVMVNC